MKINTLKTISAILLLTVIWSCNSRSNNTCDLSIDIDSVTSDSLDIASFVDSITYIDLKTPNNEFVGYVSCARIKGPHIIIKDNNNNAAVALFDINGNFISRIGHRGQGPGEYIDVTAIDIDCDTVYIYDQRLQSVLKYDLAGRYIDKDSIGFGDDFAVTRIDGLKRYLLANYSASRDEMAGVFLICPEPFSSKKILARRDKQVDNNRVCEFSFNDSSIRTMTNDFEYKLMRLDGDSLVCEYEFDITPAPDRNKIENWAPGYENDMAYYMRTNFYDAGRWIMFSFSKVNNLRLVLFDKKSGAYQVSSRYKNSLDNTDSFYFKPSVLNNALLGITIPNDDENPRIMLAHLKK